MRTVFFIVMSLCFLLQNPALSASAGGKPVEQQREALVKRSGEILKALYAAKPQAEADIKKSYGYATFSDFGIKILVAGGGNGRGVAINNSTGEKTFMRMMEIQAGLGFGIKKFMLIWVFENKKAFDAFVNSGWTFGGQATAAVKSGFSGKSYQGAVSVSPGVWLYQLTAKGLALEVTVKGTRYSKDGKLNNHTPEQK
jgi:lipid-binding SYLF domain-containing protein